MSQDGGDGRLELGSYRNTERTFTFKARAHKSNFYLSHFSTAAHASPPHESSTPWDRPWGPLNIKSEEANWDNTS
jgi:hypothetical protein